MREFIQSCIVKLEDDLQHYTMVDIDRVKAKYIELELEDYKKVLKELEHLEHLKEANQLLTQKISKLQQENEKLKKERN